MHRLLDTNAPVVYNTKRKGGMLTHPARPDKNTDLISVGYSITKS